MNITKTSNKKACIITSLVLFIILAVIIYINVASILEWTEKSQKYTNVTGVVSDVLEDKQTYSTDDGKSTKYYYAIEVEYYVNSEVYTICSAYDMPSSVEVGDNYVIMYRQEDPKLAYIAEKNFLTDAYIPYNVLSESIWLAIYVILGIALICLSFCFDNSKLIGVFLCGGLCILGFGGGIAGIKMGSLACAWLFLFGLVGLLVMYKIFISKVKVESVDTDDTDVF